MSSPAHHAAETPMMRTTTLIRRLWVGEVPLAQAFWEYTIVYGSLVNLVATLFYLFLLTTEVPGAVALVVFFLPLPYNILVLAAVWRSAGNYPGPRMWADLARVAIVVWELAAIAT